MTQQLPPGFEVLPEGFEIEQPQNTGLPPGFEVLPEGFEVVQEQPQPLQQVTPIKKTMAELVAEKTNNLQGDPLRKSTIEMDAGRNIPADVLTENKVKSMGVLTKERIDKIKMERLRKGQGKDQLAFDKNQNEISKKYGQDFRALPQDKQFVDVGGKAQPVTKLEFLESAEPTGTIQDAVLPIDVQEKIETYKSLKNKYEPYEYTINMRKQQLDDTGEQIKELLSKDVANLSEEEQKKLIELSAKYKETADKHEASLKNFNEASQDLQTLMARPLKDNTTGEIFSRAIGNVPEQFLQAREGLQASFQDTVQSGINTFKNKGFDPMTAQKLAWINGDDAIYNRGFERDVIDKYTQEFKKGNIDKNTLNKIGETQIQLYLNGLNDKDRRKFEVDNKELFTKQIEGTKENIAKLESEKEAYNSGDNYLGWLVGAGTESIGQMAPAALVTLITRNPNLGANLMLAQEFGGNYAEYVNDPNLSIEQRQKISATKALASAISEKIPLGVALKQFDNIGLKIGKTAQAESLTEAITEAAHIGLEQGIINQETTMPEAITRLSQAGLLGGVVGGTMGGSFALAETDPLKAEIKKGFKQGEKVDSNLEAVKALTPDQNTQAEPEQLPELKTDQSGEFDIEQGIQQDQPVELGVPELPEGFEVIEEPAVKAEPKQDVTDTDVGDIKEEPAKQQTKGLEVIEAPISELTISEDVPQFKSGADQSGVVEPLGGKFERTGVAPIQIWVRKDGSKEVISGRHRLDLAKRSGEQTIPAQYHYESDGFSAEQAAGLDALLNIREGQGKVKDYVDFIQATKPTKAEANEQGILARQTGQRAYTIANSGSDALITAHRNDQVTDEGAARIAQAAPNNEALQAVGIKAINDGKSIGVAENMVKAVKSLAGDAPQQSGDMFGFDDSALIEAEKLANAANKKQREIQRSLSAITGAAKRPALAKKEGINIKDPEAVKARIEELKQLKNDWANWHTNPELLAELKGEKITQEKPKEKTTNKYESLSDKELSNEIEELGNIIKKVESETKDSQMTQNQSGVGYLTEEQKTKFHELKLELQKRDTPEAAKARIKSRRKKPKQKPVKNQQVTEDKAKTSKNVSPMEQEFIDAKTPQPEGVLNSTLTKELGSDGVLYSRTFTPKQKLAMEPANKNNLPLQEKNALDEVQNKLNDGPMSNNPPNFYELEKLGLMPDWKETFMLQGKKIKNASEYKPQKREGIIVHVKDIIGTRIYNNRIKKKNVAGYYNTINGELRMGKFGDVEVLAHEMAHYLDFYYKAKRQISEIYNKPEYKKEVESFSYTQDKKLLLTEGFAEYVRAWLTNYDYAKINAPKFTRAFEHYLKQNKKLKRQMDSLQIKMHRWYLQGDKARLMEGISGEKTLGKSLTLKEKMMRLKQVELSNEFKQGVFDYLHAAKVMSREVKGGLETGINEPYKMLQLLHGADQIFAESYLRGAPYYKKDGSIDFKGVSLDQVWGESKKAGHKRIKDQEAYFAAMRAQEATKKGTEKLFTPGMIKEGLAKAEEYPYFKKAFEDYQKFNKAMLQFYVDSGYISKDSMKAFLRNNTAYVAFHRAIHGVDKDGAAGCSNIGARQTGAEESILHIYDNTVKQTGIHMAAALKARAMRALYEQTLSGSGKDIKESGSRFVTRATTDTKPITVDAEQIAKTILQEGTENALKPKDLELEHKGKPVKTMAELVEYLNNNPDLLKFWTFGHPPKDRRTDFDSYIDKNGDTKWVQINEDNTLLPSMIDALQGMNLPENQYTKLLARLPLIYKNLKTLGITSAWQFAGGNIIRDSSTAAALSGFKFKPVYSHLKGLAYMVESVWNKNGLVGELRGNGGYSGGRVQSTLYDNWGLTGSNSEYLSEKEWYRSPLRIAKELVTAYAKVSDVAEMMTRVGFYAEQRKAGVDPVEAAWQTRQITTDFQKRGANPQLAYAVRTSAFLNAGMQGFMREMEALFEVNGEMKLGNLLKDENGFITLQSVKARMYGTMMVLSGLAMMSAYLMMNSDDEDDRELYKNLTPDERSRFIHLPGGTKLPKPIGVFGFSMAMSEIGINNHLNPDEDKKFLKDDVLFSLGYHLALSGSPSMLQLPLDFISGEDWKGAPIVPVSLEGVKLDKQYNERTGLAYIQVAKEIKDKFGIELSPIQSEYVVKNTLGYYSEYFKEYTDRLFWDYENWGERPFQKTFTDISFRQFKKDERVFRNKYTAAYYDLYTEAREAAKTQGVDFDHMVQGIITGDLDITAYDATLIELGSAMAELNKAYKEQALGNIISDRNKNLTAKQKEAKHIQLLDAKNKQFENTFKNFKKILDNIKKQETN